jgi:predicted nucleic acid-binding Zn ribbon protein
MAFFDKLKAAAEAVGDKTNDMIEITKLNAKITAETNAVSEAKKKIGNIIFDYYQKGESFPSEIGELCESIKKSQASIDALQNEIAAIKSDGAKPAASQSKVYGQAGSACPACGASNAPGVRFCSECGSKLEAEGPAKRFCPSCGAEVEAGVRFCGECGSKME